jgi:excisionase family DNA binding protein
MDNAILLQNISPEDLFSKMRELIAEELSKRLQPETPQRYITKKEAAVKLRLSLPTLNRLTSDGTLTGYRVGRRVLYKSDQIDQALSEIQTLKYKRG